MIQHGMFDDGPPSFFLISGVSDFSPAGVGELQAVTSAKKAVAHETVTRTKR